MTVNVAVIIPAKIAESVQTTQYTSTGATTIIDKFTATNYSAAAATISINLVTYTYGTGNDNLIVKTHTIQPGMTYTFPEIVGFALGSGDYISTLAGTASSINIRASGRVIT